MKRSLKHGLSNVDHVRAAIDTAYKANIGRLGAVSPKMVWTSSHVATVTVTMMTKTITANVTIANEEVLVETKVPFLVSHLEGKIIQTLSEHLEASFSKAQAEEAGLQSSGRSRL